MGKSDEKNPWKFFVDHCDGDFFQSLPAGQIQAKKPKASVHAAALYDGAENRLLGNLSEKPSYGILRPSQIKLKGKTAAEDNFADVEEADVRTHTVRADAAVVGTLVHSLMEAIISCRNTAPLSALVQEISSEYEAEGESYRKLLTYVGTGILNGGFPQKSDAPEDILSTLLSADEVYCEVPFCRKVDNDI